MKPEEKIQVDTLGDWVRTHDCGALRKTDAGREVILMGWVNRRRDLGGLIFVDLRDREGLTQAVFDPQREPDAHGRAHVLRNEWVVAIKGTVGPRLEGQENTQLPTGAIEVLVREIRILNHTETPPFQVDGAVDASETLRMKYRYLELRRLEVFRNFRMRHQIASTIRTYLDARKFIEVETPFLTRSTPEGARDYLVPSRVNRGMFYALPQSPQLFKQLLMMSGFDRYYQIVRCFRDEDLRADRQPEFTQVDLEMAFVDESAVMGLVEGLIAHLFQEVLGYPLTLPLLCLSYEEAMERFGTDKPDMRFGMELFDLSDMAARSEFSVFAAALAASGVVKAIRAEGAAEAYSRKALDGLSKLATDAGARGLAWIKVTGDGWQSPLSRFFSEDLQRAVNERAQATPGDLMLIVADQAPVANRTLGMLRLEVARKLERISKDRYAFLWVTRFPLLEYDETEGRFVAVHHPFTAPLEDHLALLKENPERVQARSYDLVLNGSEIGGGSIRIHNPAVQEEVFQTLGIAPEEARARFGFLLEALRYGAPPHGGMALGFDRLVAIMTGAASIREVIAFPKTTSGSCPLTEAPSRVDPRQLAELGLQPGPSSGQWG